MFHSTMYTYMYVDSSSLAEYTMYMYMYAHVMDTEKTSGE